MKSDEEAQKAIHNKHKSKYSDENPPLQNPFFFVCVCPAMTAGPSQRVKLTGYVLFHGGGGGLNNQRLSSTVSFEITRTSRPHRLFPPQVSVPGFDPIRPWI